MAEVRCPACQGEFPGFYQDLGNPETKHPLMGSYQIKLGDWAICCHCKAKLRFAMRPDGQLFPRMTTQRECELEAPENLEELIQKLPSVRPPL